LPESELRAGLFESIKAGLIRDRALFNLMERERTSILSRDPALLERVITASVRMKAAVVGEDERESGLRMILNFGHTVGHAIEAVAGYGKLLHGEAVGWGMLAALEISRLRGLPAKDYMRATVVIRAYGLPPLPALSAEKLVEATGRDKKNTAGMRRFVLLRSLGDAYVTDTVTNDELATGISAILSPAQR
jgi:3-dehydroquinate synthase